MKSVAVVRVGLAILSLPMRGEWIEIMAAKKGGRGCASLPMRGEWIEIQSRDESANPHNCLSPCGESGLKSSDLSI